MNRDDALDTRIEKVTAAMGLGVELMSIRMHEAKNRIGNIKAALQLEMLHRRTASRNCEADHLEGVVREVDLLEDLLRQVTDIPASQSGSTPLATISLNELLRSALGGLAYRANLKGVTVTPMANGRIEMCEEKLKLLQRIVFALADNAVTFAPAQTGEVRIIANVVDGNNLTIEVGDNGLGVDVSRTEKIFRPRFTTRPTGTGMGLYLAKSLTERQFGGSLIHRGDNEYGASFIVSIPIDGG